MQKKHKNIIIAAGGTGGHLFPAQGLASHLQEKNSEYSIVFMGKGLKTNRFFRQDLFVHREVEALALSLRHPLRFIFSIGKGVWQA